MSAEPSGSGKKNKKGESKAPRKLVLCFDGTGNTISGTSSDTNIVKFYQMCDQTAKGQFHYYQPGIGTSSEGSINAGFLGGTYRWPSQAIDQAFGASLDHHVLEGYKFVMRNYEPGDRIYLFGFGRGAFTARFLARMISEVGVLSKVNEKMFVLLAFRTYHDYELGQNGSARSLEECRSFMKNFKETFCRPGVHTHFLGLFDTVNSAVAHEVPFRKETSLPEATHIRHAVSIDEHRLKFKPVLFSHDDGAATQNIKEVWFAGSHSDVGGGWAPGKDTDGKDTDGKDTDEKDTDGKDTDGKDTEGKDIDGDDTDVQLSDIALEWMLREVDQLPGPPTEKLAFNDLCARFLDTMAERRADAIGGGVAHNAQSFGQDWGWTWVLFWWILEIFPIFKRLELKDGKWVPTCWLPNLGCTRDLPPSATLHPSVIQRVRSKGGKSYSPNNSGFEAAFKQHSVENGAN